MRPRIKNKLKKGREKGIIRETTYNCLATVTIGSDRFVRAVYLRPGGLREAAGNESDRRSGVGSAAGEVSIVCYIEDTGVRPNRRDLPENGSIALKYPGPL